MSEIVTTVVAPDSEALTRGAQQALDMARELTIDSEPMLAIAAGELQQIKLKAKQLEEQRVAITKPLLEAKRRVDDLFRRPLDYLAQAETLLKGAISGYQRRVEEARRIEAARLADLQRKEAAKLAAQAAKALAAGKEEKAAELAVRAEAATMVQAAPVEAPKVEGISVRKKYGAEVVDKGALLGFIVANPSFTYLLAVDTSALNKLAAAQRDAFALPGCKLVVEDVVSARAP